MYNVENGWAAASELSALLEKSLPGTQHWEAEGQDPLSPNPPGFPNLCMLTASFSLAFINS